MKKNILTRSKLTALASFVTLYGLLSGTPAIAQHVLYYHGNDTLQVLNNNSFRTLQEGVNYPVVGVDSDGSLLLYVQGVRCPYKTKDLRYGFRVLNGGAYSSLTIKAPEVKSWLEFTPPKLIVFHDPRKIQTVNTGWNNAYYQTVLVSPMTVGQCYTVFQVYDDNGAVIGTSVQVMGSVLTANEPTKIAHRIFIGNSNVSLDSNKLRTGFYFFSGNLEVPVATAENSFPQNDNPDNIKLNQDPSWNK